MFYEPTSVYAMHDNLEQFKTHITGITAEMLHDQEFIQHVLLYAIEADTYQCYKYLYQLSIDGNCSDLFKHITHLYLNKKRQSLQDKLDTIDELFTLIKY